MSDNLVLAFDGKLEARSDFLARVRIAVAGFIGERMTLEALIVEAVKNIYDHAEKQGSIVLCRTGRTISFEISSPSRAPLSYECLRTKASGANNGLNFGVGLGMIESIAVTLNISLQIDDSAGLKYSGTYTPN